MVSVFPFCHPARTPSSTGPRHTAPPASEAPPTLRAGRLTLPRHSDVLDALACQETGLVWFHDRPGPTP
ncbi:hypothetical protein KGY14_07925 [Ameyamaea chiangmaiensis]|nr:hypothetical protein [Ameyamaea chiangmaiensis]MBS4075117.1 hypothetical protein [Ameyamaea chiangmaiensis]